MCGWVRPDALAALIAYVSAIGAAVIGIAILGARDTRTAAHAIEALATLPLMGGVRSPDAIPRVLHSMAPENGSEPVSVESDAFLHARPAPALFARLSEDEIAELKMATVERIVTDDASPWHHGDRQTYKTVCVRLCDGAYFPISFATTRDHFAKDEAQCTARCGSPVRLFVFPNPGGRPEVMRDRSGRSYVALPTAFQFRHGPVAGCSCRAAPWEAASRVRHRLYALEADIAAGKAVDTTELASLRSRVTDADDESPSQMTPVPSSPAAAKKENSFRPNRARSLGPAAAIARQAPAPVDVRTLSPEMEIAALETAQETPRNFSPGNRTNRSAGLDATPPLPTRPRTGDNEGNRVMSGVTGDRKAIPQDGMRRPSRQLTVDDAGLGQRIPRGLAARAIWGIGPNAYGAPRGTSARDTFARNFF